MDESSRGEEESNHSSLAAATAPPTTSQGVPSVVVVTPESSQVESSSGDESAHEDKSTTATMGGKPQAATRKFQVGNEVELKTLVPTPSYDGVVTEFQFCKVERIYEYRINWHCHRGYEGTWYPEERLARKTNQRKRKKKELHNISKQRVCTFESRNPNACHKPSQRVKAIAREKCRKGLGWMPCIYVRGSVERALDDAGYPYAIQNAMHYLQERKQVSTKPIPPEIRNGTEIEKFFERCRQSFSGIVVDQDVCKKTNKVIYKVEYNDGDSEDLFASEIRPCMANNIHDRDFHCLELFSGSGVVSQAFSDNGFTVESVDICQQDDAVFAPTLVKDIMDLDPSRDLVNVPDFVWASFLCTTNSKLAGDKHRVVKDTCFKSHNLAISEEARQHDLLFAKFAEILYWILWQNILIASL